MTHWSAVAQEGGPSERELLRAAHEARGGIEPPPMERADSVVPRVSGWAVVVAVLFLGVYLSLLRYPNLKGSYVDGGAIRLMLALAGLVPVGLLLRDWLRFRRTRLRRFAAVVRSVRSDQRTRDAFRFIRRSHSVRIEPLHGFSRRLAVDRGLLGRLVEGDVGVAFVRGGRLVGFVPVRIEGGEVRFSAPARAGEEGA